MSVSTAGTMRYKGTQVQILKVLGGYFHLHTRKRVRGFILDWGIPEITVLFDTRFYGHGEGDLAPTGQTSGTPGCYLKYASSRSADEPTPLRTTWCEQGAVGTAGDCGSTNPWQPPPPLPGWEI